MKNKETIQPAVGASSVEPSYNVATGFMNSNSKLLIPDSTAFAQQRIPPS